MITEPVLLRLQQATHVTLRVLAARLADLELTPAELNVLANLADGSEPTVSELAALAGIRTTTLTGILDRLERQGHLTRVPHAADRRAVVVETTRTGRRVARRVAETMAAVEAQAFDGLPDKVVANCRRALHALTEVKP